MRNISILIFIAALVIGSITVMMTRSYINSQRAKPATANAENGPDQEMGTLVVAAGPLNFGDEITPEMLREVPWPLGDDVRPPNSFSQISEVSSGTRRVAIRSIAKNEPIVQGKISGFGYRATLSQVVAPDMRAVAIRISDVTGVGGFVLPGDRVDVIYTRDERQRGAGQARIAHSKLLIRDVRVLAVDQTADESTDGAVIAKAATLEVSGEQAQKIALAARIGELDLALRPMVARGDVLDMTSATIEVSDLQNDNKLGIEPEETPQVKPRAYRPVSRKRSTVATKPAPDPFGTMRVTRGTTTSEDSVVKESVATSTRRDIALAGGTPSATNALGSYPGTVSQQMVGTLAGGSPPNP